MPVIIGCVIFFVLIIIFVFVGPTLDRKDIRKKQIKILNDKGYKLDMTYIGECLTKFDIYLDTKHKKLLIFNGKFLIYNFKDLNDLSIKKEVNEGIYKYLIDFKLIDKDYNIILKGNISENKKIKYEELAKILNYVDNINKEEIKKLEEKKKTTKKVSKKTTKTIDDTKKKTKSTKSETKKATKTKNTPKKTSKANKK